MQAPHEIARPSSRRRLISPLSPMGLALVAYAFFLATTLFPPGAYEMLMQEPNRIFLHPVANILVLLCIFSFVAGATLFRAIRPKLGREVARKPFGRIALLAPLAAAVGLNVYSITIFLENNPNFLIGWLADGTAVKQELDTSNGLPEALPLLYAVTWWLTWRLLEREAALQRPDYIVRSLLWVGIGIAVFTAVAKVARYDLMPGLTGLFVVYYSFKYKSRAISFKKYLLSLANFGVIVVAIFLLFSWLRGGTESFSLIQDIIGYTVASYNRLPDVVMGELQYPYAGTGTYAFRFLEHIPLLQRWFDLGAYFGMPSSEDVWLSEFGAVSQTGLDGRFIWSSAFGYLYSDLGIFALGYFFAMGYFAAHSWKSMKCGGAFGIVMYPWIAFSIMFWFGSNFFAYPRLITVLGTALLLSTYERVIKPRRAKNSIRGNRNAEA